MAAGGRRDRRCSEDAVAVEMSQDKTGELFDLVVGSVSKAKEDARLSHRG